MYGKHDKWVIQYLGLSGRWKTFAASFRTESLANIEREKMEKSENKIGQGRYRVRRRDK